MSKEIDTEPLKLTYLAILWNVDIYPSQLNGTEQKGYVPQNQGSFSKSDTTPGVVGHRR